MSLTPISITTATPEQGDLCRHREHAAVRREFAQALGLDVGRQAVIRRDAGRFALYTLTDGDSQVTDRASEAAEASEASEDVVRMGPAGRARLDGADEDRFDGLLDSVAVDPAATPDEAAHGEKLLELLDDDGEPAGLIVLAPHGGDIEPFTDDQAEHVRDLLTDLGVACWRCKGWHPHGSAGARWHITSTEISTGSFPRLGTVATRGFRHALSFHGFVDDRRPDVLVGGAAPDPLKRVIRAVIASALGGTGLTVEIVGRGDPLGGAEQANLVNRLTADGRGGIQIEQQPAARSAVVPGAHVPGWQVIASAVADIYRAVLTESAARRPAP